MDRLTDRTDDTLCDLLWVTDSDSDEVSFSVTESLPLAVVVAVMEYERDMDAVGDAEIDEVCGRLPV